MMKKAVCFLLVSAVVTGCATTRSSVIYPALPPGLKQAVPAPELMRNGRLITPQFPAVAVKQRIQGGTCFRFVVEANGKPSNIEVVDSQPAGVFDAEAQKALSQWFFVPDKVDGNAVRSLDQGYCLDFKLSY